MFSLDETDRLDAGSKEVDMVLHCAGPFSLTSKPMVEACLRNKKHYTDITGEIAVFEACAARDKQAKDAGVMLMPGVGFDVVPSRLSRTAFEKPTADGDEFITRVLRHGPHLARHAGDDDDERRQGRCDPQRR